MRPNSFSVRFFRGCYANFFVCLSRKTARAHALRGGGYCEKNWAESPKPTTKKNAHAGQQPPISRNERTPPNNAANEEQHPPPIPPTMNPTTKQNRRQSPHTTPTQDDNARTHGSLLYRIDKSRAVRRRTVDICTLLTLQKPPLFMRYYSTN